MGLPTISFGGVASGLDINAIIRALVSLKDRPIQLQRNRRANLSGAQSDFSTLRGHLDALQDVAKDFKKASAFQAFTVESSDKDVLTASIDGSAQSGTYQIHVDTLAQQEIDVAQGFADTDTTTFGTGTLKITVDGEETEITLDSSNNTLANLVDAINTADAGVSATIVNSGGANPYNLVITAERSGTDNAINYDYTGYTAGDVDLQSALAVEQTAEDATLTINGIDLTRSSNTIDDAIAGVTINLLDVNALPADKVTLTTSTNVEGIQEDIEKVVDAYNDVQRFIDTQFSYSETTGAGGRLFGDFTLSSVRNRIQSIATTAVSGTGLYGSLGAIGVTTQSDGTLSIDQDELTDAIENDPEGVVSLFVQGEGAIAASLESAIAEFTKFDGILDARDDGIQSQIRSIDDQIERAERRLDDYEAQQTRRFAAYESIIGGLQSQLSFLTASLRTPVR